MERLIKTMRVTFIAHSGFLIETAGKYLLFDYYKGELPALDRDKPLCVFASHRHQDHFNPVVFRLGESHPHTTYYLSYDIKLKPYYLQKWGVGEALAAKIRPLRANGVYTGGDMEITTLKSTDQGVAFLVRTEGKTLYHAGDLNWWHWAEEGKQWNNNMAANFKREADKLTGVSIDAAFLPLDPRQKESCRLGFDYVLNTAKVAVAFPMHMWEDYSVISRYLEEGGAEGCDTNVIKICGEGQSWEL